MRAKKHVIVVGGGAAGMTAAISARRLGAVVTILERNPRVGKKILATGNGRCNYTNLNAGIDCLHGHDPGFALGALSQFTVDDTLRFFEKLGITPKVEENGKVFPMSEQASSILDVLLYELNELGVNTVCEAFVHSIKPQDDGFILELDNGNTYRGNSVVIATGGKAFPSSGSDGNGYKLAKALGHTVTDVFPALVQLMLEGDFFKRIEGVKIVGTAQLLHHNKPLAQDRGDILFANYGVSGPPILQLSRKAGELLNRGEEAWLKISLIDTISRDELRKLLAKRFQTAPQKPLDFSLVGLINKRLIPVVLKEAGVSDLKKQAGGFSPAEQEALLDVLTGWTLKVRGTKGWTSAQVTAGGVATGEIEPRTLESKLVKGLYFAGEVLDIDGLCGGYNLQWAWSSGFVAGRNAAL